ncbi:unnamed protein product [Chrysoparadoxa australica]
MPAESRGRPASRLRPPLQATSSNANAGSGRFGFKAPVVEEEKGENTASAAKSKSPPAPSNTRATRSKKNSTTTGKRQRDESQSSRGAAKEPEAKESPRKKAVVGSTTTRRASQTTEGSVSGSRRGSSATRSSSISYKVNESQVEVLAAKTFTSTVEELGLLIRKKVQGSKYDYKEKLSSSQKLLMEHRSALNHEAKQRDAFVSGCIAVEAGLQAQVRDTSGRLEIIECEHQKAAVEMAKIKESQADMVRDLACALKERDDLSKARDELEGSASAWEKRTKEAEEKLASMEVRLSQADEDGRIASREAALNKERMNTLESEKTVALVQLEQELKAQLEGQMASLSTDLASTRATLEAKQAELSRVQEERSGSTKKASEMMEDLLRCQSRLKESESDKARLEGDVVRLREDLADVRGQLDAKSKELTSTLTSFSEGQRAADKRESELRDGRRELEARVVALELEKAKLGVELTARKEEVASLTAEWNSAKEQLVILKEEASSRKDAMRDAHGKVSQACEALAVEKELRARAEVKEEEERRERTSATAQLMAMESAQASEKERFKQDLSMKDREWEARLTTAQADMQALRHEARVANEKAVELEGEVRTLKVAVQDAQTNEQQLVELSRAQGEMDVLRSRLAIMEQERQSTAAGQSAQIIELEEKVRNGETQRRKMHNLIQELRGNVRVFARVRPFLPNDCAPEGAVPVITPKGDGVSCRITKTGSNGQADSHSFTFDKMFPPSAGQQQVFGEVSEFVQSALDGYNVCLFSYGQTGSGKTHTMQGSGQGQMRGIIPRAMEQVGQYKAKLEADGWEYTMQVSFLEIYNEEIRDLLRDRSPGKPYDAKHEIKRDQRGETTVTDLSMHQVDPLCTDQVEALLNDAARNRSVSKTDMNAQSSRSHSVFTLYLRAKNEKTRSSVKGSLHLVDLAGSERVSRSGVTGDRLKETVNINKSLSSLTDVFVALSNKQSHIPFRNSKLTYLLQPALSGDGKTLMLCNLSPTEASCQESLCSLKFASQVNQCELGKPKKNVKDLGSSSSGSTPRNGQARKTASGK